MYISINYPIKYELHVHDYRMPTPSCLKRSLKPQFKTSVLLEQKTHLGEMSYLKIYSHKTKIFKNV